MSRLACQMQPNQILFAFLFCLKLCKIDADYDDDPTEDEAPLCTLKSIQYAASLAMLKKSTILCGGFLISPRWFVTTCACTYLIDRPSDYIIMAGSSTLTKFLCKKMYKHPQYDLKTGENDITIVRVLGAFPKTLDYPRLAGKGFAAKCKNVTIVTWAGNRQGSHIYNLEELPELFCMMAELLDLRVCTANEAAVTVPHNKLLCSSPGTTSEHPCKGDMGGPLLCNNVVVGMSFRSGDCRAPHKQQLTAYVKIEEYSDFFKSVLKTNGDTLKEKKEKDVITYTVGKSCADDGFKISLRMFGFCALGISWLRLSFSF